MAEADSLTTLRLTRLNIDISISLSSGRLALERVEWVGADRQRPSWAKSIISFDAPPLIRCCSTL
jgi:hypothetical protein